MDKKQLRLLLAEKNTQVKALAAKAELTPEELAAWDALLVEMEGIKANIERLERSESQEAFLTEPAGTKAAHLGWTTTQIDVIKDEADQPFKNAGEFFMAVKTAALYPNREDVRLHSLKAPLGMSEGVPADGGYLVQPQYAGGILERMYGIGSLLQRVSQDPTSGNDMTYNAVDETSRANGSRWGGVQGYWVAEAAAPTSSKGKFRQVNLKLKDVAALCYATNDMLQDGPALGNWLGRTVPDELRFKVEDAIYEGDGAGKPLGIMNSPSLVSVTRVDANKVQYTDVIAMWSRRYAALTDYVWLINQDVNPQLQQLGTTYQLMYTPPGGLSAAPYGSLFGRPVIEVEYAATLGTTGDIMLASLSQYQTITKGGIQADSSIHCAFTTFDTAFRFIYRIDGAPLWNSALTPFKGTNTQSPFVVLTTAS